MIKLTRTDATLFDEASLKKVIDKYSQNLLAYVVCIVKSKVLAEEVVGDVFIELWNKRDKIEELESLKAWLLVLARNKSISTLRKEERHRYQFEIDEVGFDLACDFMTPDEEMISSEEISRITTAIRLLPARCQEVFILAKIQKIPYKEIATMLNISVKTINIHISKAISAIANAIY